MLSDTSCLESVIEIEYICFPELSHVDFDRIDLLCLAGSFAFGVWYLLKKVGATVNSIELRVSSHHVVCGATEFQ